MGYRSVKCFLLCGSLLLGACGTGPKVASEDNLKLCLPRDGQALPLNTELATTQTQRQQGLQERDSLERLSGMLFLYDQPQPPQQGFWMYRTQIPLSVAWLNIQGQVLGIQEMRPCSAEESGDCPVYKAGVPFQAALEVNAGLFAQLGIGKGDTLRVAAGPDSDPCGATRSLQTLFD